MILQWLFGAKNLLRLKLALWVGVLIWMLFFTVLGGVYSYSFVKFDYGQTFYGENLWGKFLTYITPAWIMFTTLLVDIYVAAFVSRKLSRKED